MSSILKGFMGLTDMKTNDHVIALSTSIAIKSAAHAYLAASLNAVTPEVGRLCSDYLNKKLAANEALTALIIKNNWAQPYASPQEQISQACKQSDWVLNQTQ